MKCNEAEKLILLQDSGEMAKKKRSGLTTHLHDCKPCHRFQHTVMESQEAFKATDEPPIAVLNHVKREARWLAPEKGRKILIFNPAVALAAALLIGLGVFFSTLRYNQIGLELILTETELLDTSDQIVRVMYNGLTEDDLAFNFIMTFDEEG